MQATDAALSRRIAAVDVLRGLDHDHHGAGSHARLLFEVQRLIRPIRCTRGRALFFTRWITHLCAPGFVALAGTSVYLQRQRGRTRGETGQKLVLRGIWLMFVEVAVVSFGLFFTYHVHFFQVIYAIGGSMIVLAALQFLPVRWVAAYGFAVVLLHDLLKGIQPEQLGRAAWLWEFLVSTGLFFHGASCGCL